MSTNMELITSVTVGSGGAASVTLPATGTIPATYTDLKVVASVRTEGTGTPYLYLRFNGSSTNYSNRRIIGDGSAISSSAPSDAYIIGGICNTTTQTASTFSSHDIYIPNYAGSNNKSVSVDAVTENNDTAARAILLASLWADSAAITSIVFTNEAAVDFAEGSTFYLYGISNVTSTTKATGGIVSSDGTYNYHMFPYSGTFTPTAAITVDYLVIAGGGGKSATGAGAGGLRSTVGATGGGGSLESAVSLTANTAYTITVGAGGAYSGSVSTTNGSNGGDSSIAGSGLTTITSTGGAGGMNSADNSRNGQTGGSGSGGWQGGAASGTRAGGAATASPVQGFAGGSAAAFTASTSSGGAGGGAGAVGGTPASGDTLANGGNGVQILAFATATGTGANNGYYAGGGGSGIYVNGAASLGGLGGGGAGATGNAAGSSGVTNTGGGAGAAYSPAYASAAYNGGSGLVIIRYAI